MNWSRKHKIVSGEFCIERAGERLFCLYRLRDLLGVFETLPQAKKAAQREAVRTPYNRESLCFRPVTNSTTHARGFEPFSLTPFPDQHGESTDE